ncbi:subtilisin-like protease SBT3.1 [Canna indica]|uniref:Subtilisin-like protease SBT3.1 n=1 Tax=Canna indica TaxID=4628 RepID=A0AAQ3K7X4_9LILI|nr:subtilisin-like protease SBT3.1 [Canna indica]
MEIMKSTMPIPVAFAVLVASLLFLSSLSSSPTAAKEEETASVYIVFVEEPVGEEPEAFHVRTLAAVLGSEAAAKRAILFHYTHAASGFAAKLTAEQVEKLEKQPGVIQVIRSRTYSIHEPISSGGVVM